jgi:anti-sigma regulatory factor (Ser/Thr protein kinase)
MQARAAVERREPGRPPRPLCAYGDISATHAKRDCIQTAPEWCWATGQRGHPGRFPGLRGGAFPVAGGSRKPRTGRDAQGEVRAASVVVLPFMPASVAVARGQFRAELRSAGVVAAPAADAALVLSELLSNAILHARPLPDSLVQVAWELSPPSLEVMVSDGGSVTRPHASRPSLSAIGGRGLSIVEQLCSARGVRADERGTTVWAVLPAPCARHGGGPGASALTAP